MVRQVLRGAASDNTPEDGYVSWGKEPTPTGRGRGKAPQLVPSYERRAPLVDSSRTELVAESWKPESVWVTNQGEGRHSLRDSSGYPG